VRDFLVDADPAASVMAHLGGGDGALVDPTELLDGLLVEAKVLLAADEDDGQARAKVVDLGDPLFLDVVEGVGRVDGEADEDDVRVGVGERPQSVIIFLTGGIPQCELDGPATDVDLGNVILKDGGDIELQASVR
jgi:hypothetical protein